LSLYPDSEYPVRDEIAAIHARQFANITSAGTWGSGRQRHALAVEARRAGIEAGLLEPLPGGPEQAETGLPEAVRDVVRTIAVSVRSLGQEFCGQVLAGGLSDAEFVEIVGVVSRLVDLDVFARGIGVPLRPLPSPSQGEPTRLRPETAVPEHAFVPTIPNGPAGGDIGAELYHGHPMPYIVRALSLVPDELKAHVELEVAHYTRLDKLFDFDYQHHEGLTRSQAEVVAGRISALNDCFY